MRVIGNPGEMQAAALGWRRGARRVGLVPTMGFLHEGHLSLVRLARRHADAVVVSLFVNPAQFGPQEDFARYPRDPARDEALCRAAGADVVFCPAAEAMYAGDASVHVVEDSVTRGLCGPLRPGHFRGVLTVVAKLFNLVLPDVAVFGAKDAQQVRAVARMIRDLNVPVELLVGPTVREPDGLAMSSRNVYLAPDERRRAAGIWRSLLLARRLFGEGERDAAVLAERVRQSLRETAAPSRIDYVAVVDDASLQPLNRIADRALLAVALWIGRTRLIDNTVLGSA